MVLIEFSGRIRVYVRIRPFSQNELSMNSQEAVLKDGKMSVLLLGHQTPDSRKNFDFDQVHILPRTTLITLGFLWSKQKWEQSTGRFP